MGRRTQSLSSLLKTTSRRRRPAASSSQAQVFNGLTGCGHVPSIQADVVAELSIQWGRGARGPQRVSWKVTAAPSPSTSPWPPAPWLDPGLKLPAQGSTGQQSLLPQEMLLHELSPGVCARRGCWPEALHCLSAGARGLRAGVVRVRGAGGALETRAESRPGP